MVITIIKGNDRVIPKTFFVMTLRYRAVKIISNISKLIISKKTKISYYTYHCKLLNAKSHATFLFNLARPYNERQEILDVM